MEIQHNRLLSMKLQCGLSIYSKLKKNRIVSKLVKDSDSG